MTDAKDYVEARSNHLARAPDTIEDISDFVWSTSSSVTELKTLLEDTIDNGRHIFLENGFIPLNRHSQERVLKLDFFGCRELHRWLAKYNWIISVDLNPMSIINGIPLVLKFIKNNP